MSEPRDTNKSDFVRSIAGSTGESQSTVKRVIDEFLNNIMVQTRHDLEVSITGFGKFGRRYRAPRQVRNPQTGETMMAQDQYVPYFTPGKAFKDRVN